MKYRYTKYVGDELDDLDLEDLVAKLSDLLLGSGFDNPYGVGDDDEESGHSRQSLHDAILEAVTAFIGSAAQADDITLLVVEYSPEAAD